jgi:endoglycosylceramidase
MIRLGTMWPGAEPEKNVFNNTYIELLENITKKAATYGIYTLLDMHQDVLSEKFCGEGAPAWAMKTDGIFKKFPLPL